MLIFTTILEVQQYLKTKKKAARNIGFVPTMGALHAGHISLIERAKEENDEVVCSIFVNPTQFNNADDLRKYPRMFEQDCEILFSAGCEVVFAPSAEEMYPNAPQLKLDFGILENVMEGKFRPGHFNGVVIIVSKLFHIIKPEKAYFGLKDLQQVAVIRSLVQELSFDIVIVPCPILREVDGLAMSSRNMRLSSEARGLAPKVYQALKIAQEKLQSGATVSSTQDFIKGFFASFPAFEVEYFEVAHFDTLQPIETKTEKNKTAICIAAFLDGVRLIDNIVF
jgi:pantoate--beta-alanine ligase